MSDQPPYPPPPASQEPPPPGYPQQPPPPPGYTQQPPPPPPGYGQQPQYGQPQYGQPQWGQAPPPPPPPGYGQPGWAPQPGYTSPSGTLAEWPQRALGLLIDWVGGAAIVIVGVILGAILGAASSALGTLVAVLFYLAALVYLVIQLVKQGNTGQTIGKKVVGLKLVGETTGQPIGAGMSIVRYIAHFVDSVICYIGWLFPLWDAKKQTLADKIMHTVVVTVPKQPFNTADLYTTT